MINIVEEFENYLEEWCKQKNVNKPKKSGNKNWMLAWKDFTESFLVQHYEEIREQYLNGETVKPTESTNSAERSNWEAVKEMMEE